MDGYELIASPPSVDEYVELRRIAGLSPKTVEQAHGAIANSWTFCQIRSPDRVRAVAMGRVIGDGGWYFHIADMATHPEHQRRGLGSRVMQWLLDEIAAKAPPNPYITLLADPPGIPLYERFGFTPTPSLGMMRR